MIEMFMCPGQNNETLKYPEMSKKERKKVSHTNYSNLFAIQINLFKVYINQNRFFAFVLEISYINLALFAYVLSYPVMISVIKLQQKHKIKDAKSHDTKVHNKNISIVIPHEL